MRAAEKTARYFAGTVRVRMECAYPERAANFCASAGVEFWDFERCEDGAVRLSVTVAGYGRLRALARETGAFALRSVGRAGAPVFLHGIRKRYALLIGMGLCLALLWASSLFVWQIGVTGNETVSSEEILAVLSDLGVGIGTFTPSLRGSMVTDRALLRLPALSWMAVNVRGSRAEVVVREKVLPPRLRDEKTPSVVQAGKAGILTALRVECGTPAAAAGDAVAAGDTLISGVVGSVSSGSRLVHAAGEAAARTWYSFSDTIPLSWAEKEYTGRTKTRTALVFGEKRINLYAGSGNPYADYDKMTSCKTLLLPGGAALPLAVVKETYREYVPRGAAVTADAAGRLLEARLLARLGREIGAGSVKKTGFAYSVKNGALTVTLSAECLEEIGVSRPMTAEELALSGGAGTD